MHEEHQGGLAGQQRYEHSAEPSMGGETSGDETSVHEEELEEEDPEALVVCPTMPGHYTITKTGSFYKGNGSQSDISPANSTKPLD